MKIKILVFLFIVSTQLFAQTTVTTIPQFPTQTDDITITFDITNTNPIGKTPLKNYSGDVYAHTGVTISTNGSSGVRWQNVIGGSSSWGNNSVEPKLTSLGQNKYQIVIGNPKNYYSVSNASQIITELCFVLRSSDASKQTEDIFVPLYSAGISLVLNSPTVSLNFGDPMRSPYFITSGTTLPISATSTAGSSTKSITLYLNGTQKYQSTSSNLQYSFSSNENPSWKNIIKIIAEDVTAKKDSVQFAIVINPSVTDMPPPAGNQIGINYGSDNSSVTLALFAPYKKNVYVVGDFNDWKVDQSFYMNRYQATQDSVVWWITIPNLNPNEEYGYQFLIDGNLRIYDPYTEKILDGNNDQIIPASVYPNLKTYPTGKTSGLVSVLQVNQPKYSWKIPSFTRPPKEKLVIYELLVRDFVSTHWYQTIIDTLSYFRKLGINAIELMPVIEFGGNDSWGYNPTTYFAPDKYYGTKNDLKAFIDACHENGIAVINDIVLNHTTNENSMAQMYWDSTSNRPAADNPWFNSISPDYYSFGNDFNHESSATKYFVDRVTSFWLTEYKFDGFRFDYTKGFTNIRQQNNDGSAYNPSRIAILKRIADKIWSAVPDAYVILEHFCDNQEEIELANTGMMIWGNMNNSYSYASEGLIGNSNISDISYKARGWTAPNLVGYMESHDEERLMYNNLHLGRTLPNYDIKNLQTALNRIQLAAALFILVPGPKMIWQFGELGYDYSIDYNGRLGDKPIPWAGSGELQYNTDTERLKLFKIFAALIRLKKNYPAFSSPDFQFNAFTAVKGLYINDPDMNIAVLGNFNTYVENYPASFQPTGVWYEFFSGDNLNVTDANMTISLQPGEYRLYTSVKLPTPDFLVNVKNQSMELPGKFSLAQNYPNPFNPSTTIQFNIPVVDASSLSAAEAGTVEVHVSLKIYDVLGREIATLVNEAKAPGNYEVKFNGSGLNSGIYFYSLRAGGTVITKKMILLK